MAKKALPCPTLVRQLLRYEPETGKLFWNPRPAWMFKAAGHCTRWNTKYGGSEAFTACGGGYKEGSLLNVGVRAHTVIWAFLQGEWPRGEIDHINGDRADNRAENLRDIPKAENAKNKRMTSRNRSGHSGVFWGDHAQKWRAVIGVHGKSVHLGLFDSKSEAIQARAEAEARYGFTDRHGKDPA